MSFPTVTMQKTLSMAALLVFVVLVFATRWQSGGKPASARAEEPAQVEDLARAEAWSGTITGKRSLQAYANMRLNNRHRRERRKDYIWTVQCDGEVREVHVPQELFDQSRVGQAAIKNKGERWPRLE
ncbi:MAG: hypothetical protein ACYTHJ_18955 [Planctomycetota bacterium]|jgi:hypothetical protein